ncbi:MAG: PH domain-containing protein [Candidatus Buchananbacteria bacterium]|jgi:hypothetical protein
MLNVALLKKIWLKKEEVPILVIRGSLLNRFWPFFFSVLLLFAAFFFMYYLWQYGSWGLSAFSLAVVFAVLLFCRALYEHYYTCWVLTNLRLIDMYQHGFFRRETSEAVYDKLRDINSKKSGIIAGVFNLGDISVSLAGSRVKLLLSNVRGHERAVSEIILQQENYQNNLSDSKERRAQYMLMRIKSKIGSAAFNKLLGG